jgi:hypothetical protein
MWHQSRAALALILERNEMALHVSVVEYGAPTTIVYEMSTAIETLRFSGCGKTFHIVHVLKEWTEFQKICGFSTISEDVSDVFTIFDF